MQPDAQADVLEARLHGVLNALAVPAGQGTDQQRDHSGDEGHRQDLSDRKRWALDLGCLLCGHHGRQKQ